MWIVPQKAEHNDNLISIIVVVFVVKHTLDDLRQNGYIKSSNREEADYIKRQMYSLTEEVAR
jgi:hypothetical protein